MTKPGRNPRRTEPIPIDPDDILHYQSVDGGTDPQTTIRVRHLYGELLLHREQDLYVAPVKKGRSLQDLIRNRLIEERFDPEDADEWAFRNWIQWLNYSVKQYNEAQDAWVCDQVIQSALAYRQTGIPNDEAFAWTIRSISAEYATYLRRGWSPYAYDTLVYLCAQIYTGSTSDGGLDLVDHWAGSTIVWWRVLRYLRAGLQLEEALDHEERRLNGEDVDPAIDILIALRHQTQ